MTIYAVTQGEYSDYHIDSLYLDKNKAILRAAVLRNDDDEGIYIEEFETEDDKIDGDINKVVWEYHYHPYKDDKTGLLKFYPWDKGPSEGDPTFRTKPLNYWYTGKPKDGIYIYLDKRDDEKSRKIAEDKVAEENAKITGIV